MSGATPAPGVVVWLTGLPSSGKSTLAVRVEEALRAAGRQVVRLDGDEVRAALVPTPGYDEVARSDFYESLARLAGRDPRSGAVAGLYAAVRAILEEAPGITGLHTE